LATWEEKVNTDLVQDAAEAETSQDSKLNLWVIVADIGQHKVPQQPTENGVLGQ